MKKRIPKDTDQEETNKAYLLLMKVVDDHPEIEPSLWVGACLSAIANSFEGNGHSYTDFIKEISQAVKFYKKYWDV